MKKIQLLMAIGAVALTLSLGGKALAQPQGFGGGGPGGGMDFQNMDPQEIQKMIQQRMLDSYRDQMAVTNDTEWTLIAERITAVSQARTATMADGGGIGGMMGFGGMRGGRGGGGPGGGGPGSGFANLFGQTSGDRKSTPSELQSR